MLRLNNLCPIIVLCLCKQVYSSAIHFCNIILHYGLLFRTNCSSHNHNQWLLCALTNVINYHETSPWTIEIRGSHKANKFTFFSTRQSRWYQFLSDPMTYQRAGHSITVLPRPQWLETRKSNSYFSYWLEIAPSSWEYALTLKITITSIKQEHHNRKLIWLKSVF